MAQLVVRSVEETIVRALKMRAARHGRSAEAEHRNILRQALAGRPRRSLKAVLLEIPNVGDDADFKVARPRARRIHL